MDAFHHSLEVTQTNRTSKTSPSKPSHPSSRNPSITGRTGEVGKIDDTALLKMRSVSEKEFAKVVADKNFFPRQVANFLDLDRCLKMLHRYLTSSPSRDSLEKNLPKILSVVLQCILLNSEVIEVADEFTSTSKTPLGVSIVRSLLDMDSFKSASSFDSASGTGRYWWRFSLT